MDPDAIIISRVQDAHRRLLQVAHAVAKDTSAAEAALRSIEDAIKRRGWVNDTERALFVDNHSGELQTLKGLVMELASPSSAIPHSSRPTAQTKYPNFHKVARSFMDRVLGTQLCILKQPPTVSITRIFEQLIKGITYFADQDVAVATTSTSSKTSKTSSKRHQLIYHRLFACGDGSDAFRQTHLTCHQYGMSKEQRDVVKARIWRCYVERLIYDDLYRNMQSDAVFMTTSEDATTPIAGNAIRHQDPGHSDFLSKTHHDFQTCYPCLEVRVTVDYDYHYAYGLRMPSAVRVTRIAKCGTALDGKRATSTEVYERDVSVHPITGVREYVANVVCRRYTLEGNEYFKAQSFDSGEQSWIHVQKHAQSAPGALLDLANASGRSGLDPGSSVFTAATSHGAVAMHLDPSTDRTAR